jgi:hypothetical protein
VTGSADIVQIVPNPVEALAYIRIGFVETNRVADVVGIGRSGPEVTADPEFLKLGG